MSNQEERELGWNDTIENDGGEFTLLPEGEYPFLITGFERARHAGSDKLPPCNKAVVSVKVDGGKLGEITIRNNLFLHTKTEGLLCQFFKSIGQRQHGEKLTMDWNKVAGSKGRCKVKVVPGWKDPSKKYNEVDRFLDPDAPAAKGFTEGEF